MPQKLTTPRLPATPTTHAAAPTADPSIDYGSPFDVAYGVSPAQVEWLPQPLPTLGAGMPVAPARREVTAGWVVLTLEAMLIGALVGIVLAAMLTAPNEAPATSQPLRNPATVGQSGAQVVQEALAQLDSSNGGR